MKSDDEGDRSESKEPPAMDKPGNDEDPDTEKSLNTTDSEEEEDIEPIEPLATTRSRRSNAGNRMSELIGQETLYKDKKDEEFYTSEQVVGIFEEEEDDDDFDEDEEADEDELEEDYDVDSDFDNDETDEIAEEHRVVEPEPKRQKTTYKEPTRKVQSGITTRKPITSTPLQTARTPRPGPSATPHSPGKHRPERSFRDSTKKKTAETIKNIESVKKKRKYRNIEPQRKLTQEEMLEEAKITEEENIKSLEIYQRLESEKLKKIKLFKKSIPAPYVTYYSSVFKNPETKERYSRNMCTFVGCEPKTKKSQASIPS